MKLTNKRFKKYYYKPFVASHSSVPIITSRQEWETAPCPIDMTQVTDEEMQTFVDKMYLSSGDEETVFDEAEAWLMKNTKAQYLEDFIDNTKKVTEYQKRAKQLYYK